MVITTYNRPAWVLEAIESVLLQTRAADALVVVDDGSTDGTANRIRERFPEVRLISQSNRGQSVACNVGVTALQTDFIAFLDDDDLWHPEKLAAMDEYLDAHPACEAVNHSLWSFATNAAPLDIRLRVELVADSLAELITASQTARPTSDTSYLDIRGQSLALLMERNRGSLSGSTIKRETFMAAGLFRPELQNANDWSMFVSVARLTEWHHVERRLTFGRQHDGQSSLAGGLTNGIGILAAFLPMWFGGRAGLGGGPAIREDEASLLPYSAEYAALVRSLCWAAVVSRSRFERRTLRRLARPLFPRRRDWLSTYVPPPLWYRIDRLRQRV